MSMWSAIVLIVIAGCALEAYRAKYAGKADDERLADLEAKLDRLDNDLRERVETLERIVTDRTSNLKREFDYLDKAS
ncbi:MAG: hypothetical protein AAGH19_11995 [Pseudomonadota bacterium]